MFYFKEVDALITMTVQENLLVIVTDEMDIEMINVEVIVELLIGDQIMLEIEDLVEMAQNIETQIMTNQINIMIIGRRREVTTAAENKEVIIRGMVEVNVEEKEMVVFMKVKILSALKAQIMKQEIPTRNMVTQMKGAKVETM